MSETRGMEWNIMRLDTSTSDITKLPKIMTKYTKNINPWSELHIVYLKMLLWWPFQIFMADT